MAELHDLLAQYHTLSPPSYGSSPQDTQVQEGAGRPPAEAELQGDEPGVVHLYLHPLGDKQGVPVARHRLVQGRRPLVLAGSQGWNTV